MSTPEDKPVPFIGDRTLSESSDDIQTTSTKDQRRIYRHIDLRLLPALGLMYGISLMDRKNTSNAYVAGMGKDLDLTVGYRYSLITLVFFISYIIFQAPATVLCRTIGPRIFLPGICLAWGLLIVGFGFAKTWQTLIGLRLILGVLESGYFPGCVYLLSTWYTRYQVGKRYSIFYIVGMMSSALSGILSYGLSQMEGVGGRRGWQWIFFMQGIITCAIAIFAWIFVVKFPDEEIEQPSWGFLKPEEAKFVVTALEKDRADVKLEKFSWIQFLKPARELEIWCFAFMFFCTTTVTFSFAFFLPIILKDSLGFSVAASQCLVAPPYALAALLMFATSWYGDKHKSRAPVIIFNGVIGLIGLTIMGFVPNHSVRYFGAFIGLAGINGQIPTIMAYQANNIRGQWKRAFCSATLTGFGGIGGIAGSLVFRSQDSPRYIPGFIAVIVANTCTMAIAVFLTFLFKKRNALANEGKLVINESEDFRYTL